MELQTHEHMVALSAATGVDVPKIEKELTQMWQQASPAKGNGGEAAGITRACVLNLIVYATARDDRKEINGLLDEVFTSTPSRALILVADAEATEPDLKAAVATRCQATPRGATQICGEQVTLEASGPALDAITSAIGPLLVPDVPVFLWWKDIPHYEDKLFNRLVEMSDRVVIDSLYFDHPHEDLLRLAEIIRQHPQFMRASDLNWGRLTSWRTLIASFWDVPDYRPYLDRIERVRVEFNPPRVAPNRIAAQALLIVGWLASRLGWEVVSSEPSDGQQISRFEMRAGGERRIEIEMQALDNEEGRDGLALSLRLESAGGDASFYVARSLDSKKLETEAKVGDTLGVGRVLAYEEKTEGQRLSREVSILSRDVVYEKTVLSAAQLIATAQIN